jgi:hypothetical protein
LTVRDFEVLISLGLKIGKMHFLKVQKRAKFTLKFTSKIAVQRGPKSEENPMKQGSHADAFIEKTITTTFHATP